MNNSRFYIKTFSFFLVTFYLSCTNQDSSVLPFEEVEEALESNQSWEVSFFWDKDKDETHKFSGYTFQFKSDGKLLATINQSTTSGTWLVNSGSNKLIISFPNASDPLEELNDDWLILKKNGDTIELRDDNNEHIEELHFRMR